MSPSRKSSKRPLSVVVLAAGQGTRMKSGLAKVLHPVCGRPMIDLVLDAVEPLKPERTIVVVGHQADALRKHLRGRAECALQGERLGTGHAVKMALPKLRGFEGDVLILVGDAPLIRAETLAALAGGRRPKGWAATVLTGIFDDPKGYGRILRDGSGLVDRIVEHKDATEAERAVREINTGSYCVEAEALRSALRRLKNDNAQGEYYLTDIVGILRGDGRAVTAEVCPDPGETMGVNGRRDQTKAHDILRRRWIGEFQDAGVTVLDPETTFLDRAASIGADSTIFEGCRIEGPARIGTGCTIGPRAVIIAGQVGDGARVMESWIEDAVVEPGEEVGPYEVRWQVPPASKPSSPRPSGKATFEMRVPRPQEVPAPAKRPSARKPRS